MSEAARPRGRSAIAALAFAVAAVCVCATGGRADAARDAFSVALRPVRGPGGDVSAIEVRSQLGASASDSVARPFSLSAPIVYAGVTGIADRVEDLEVRDASGPVTFRIEDDAVAPGGFPYFRHWHAERRVTTPVTITYRSRVQPSGSPEAPPFAIRPGAGGVSGAGSGFLVLPEDTSRGDSHVQWDLTDLAAGSIGVTSFGEGDFDLSGPIGQLRQGWYMAGPVGRYPERGDVGGFSATWLGTPPFDPRQEMAWAGRMYAYLAKSFRYLDPPPRYRVFIRILEDPPYGRGTALPNSFMLSRGPAGADSSRTRPRSVFAHEMIHLWVGGIDGPRGVTSWFTEGLTTFYTRLMMMRSGFDSVAAYGRSLNESARTYYTGAGRNLPADEIARIGFGDDDIRHVPYHRGALYFADLDARIREASRGRRTLDDVVSDLFRRRQSGERFDQDAWVALVAKEIGPSARAEFDSIIVRGGTIAPASNAFGPCFERRATTYSVDGKSIEGYEWVRAPSVPDGRCRDW